MEPVPMEVDNYPEHDIPDVGPLSEEERRRDAIIRQARVDRCNELAYRRRLCVELRNVNRRFRNGTVSMRFLGAMIGDPDFYRYMKPSQMKGYMNTSF